MNIKNPLEVAFQKPYGVDVRIAAIQERLKDNVKWLEKVFGRAVAQYAAKDNLRIPRVPVGNGEFFSVMPNDSLKAFSFFYPRNPMTPTEGEQPWEKSLYFRQPVDLIIWCNLDKIDKGNLGLSEQLKAQVITELQSMSFVVVQDIYSDDVREVYEGWAVDIGQRDLLVYPFYAMRFSLLLTVLNEC